MQPGWSQENGHGRQCDGSQCKHLSELQFQEASRASCCPEMQHVQSCVRFLAHGLPHLLNPRASPCGPQTCCECRPHHHHLQILNYRIWGVWVLSFFFSLPWVASEWFPEKSGKKKLIPGIFQSFAVLTCWEELCLVGWRSASHFQDSHGEAWDETAAWTSESHQHLLLFSKLTPMTVLDLQAPAATLPLVPMPDLLHAAHLVLCLLAPSG